jgi:hypothetical protein
MADPEQQLGELGNGQHCSTLDGSVDRSRVAAAGVIGVPSGRCARMAIGRVEEHPVRDKLKGDANPQLLITTAAVA